MFFYLPSLLRYTASALEGAAVQTERSLASKGSARPLRRRGFVALGKLRRGVCWRDRSRFFIPGSRRVSSPSPFSRCCVRLPSRSRSRCKLAHSRPSGVPRSFPPPAGAFYFSNISAELRFRHVEAIQVVSDCLGPKWQAPEIGRDRVRGLLPRRWRMKNTQKQRGGKKT